MSIARQKAQPVGKGFAPYRWAAAADEVATRHGIPREAVLKFDQNTPPLPGVPQVPLAASMARLADYPDGSYRELREAAAAYTGLAPENVVVGAGADDLILLLAQTFLGPGGRAAVSEPTYALYRIATRLHGAAVVDVADEADLVWACNPNNPTGSWVEPEELVSLARERPDTILVVDEAYVEFGARSCAPWVDELENLVVVRTMSKAWGLAGLRIGYAACSTSDLAREIEKARGPYKVNAAANAAALAALQDDAGWMRDRVRDARESRGCLARRLAAMGLEAVPSDANFVFVPMSGGAAVEKAMRERGVAIRAFREGTRVTVGPWPMMESCLEALAACV